MTHATGYDGFILRYENVVADFLISYHSSDQPWADWIAWVLKEKGYGVVFQDGRDQPDSRSEPILTFRWIISILSEAYLNSEPGRAEIAANYGQDTATGAPRLLPIRVSPCNPQGRLNSIQYLDLVGQSETDAEQAILGAIATYFETDSKPSQVDLAIPKSTAKVEGVSRPVRQQQTRLAKDDSAHSGQLKLQRRTQTV